MRYLIMMLLLICNVSKAQSLDQTRQVEEISAKDDKALNKQETQENIDPKNIKMEKPKLTFLPGAPKYTGQYYKRHYRKAIKLREFKVGKKYCLWNSENWDDECQDAAMEYAYGKNWREFKKVVLDFVEYVNKMDVKNVEKLFADEKFHHFYEHYIIDSYMRGKSYLYDAIHYAQGDEIKDSDSLPLNSFNPYAVDEYRISYWKEGLNGAEYKNFLLVKPDNFWTYTLELSKNIIITFRTLDEENTLISFCKNDDGTFTIFPYEKRFTKNIYHLIPKIELVEHYIYE